MLYGILFSLLIYIIFIGSLVCVFVYFFNNNPVFKVGIKTLIEVINTMISTFNDFFKGFAQGFESAVETAEGTLRDLFCEGVNILNDIFEGIRSILDLGGAAIDGLKSIVSSIF